MALRKRVISAVILAAMLLACMISCSGDPDGEDPYGDLPLRPGDPVLEGMTGLGGRSLELLYPADPSSDADLASEDADCSVLNDEVLRRNREVERELDTHLEFCRSADIEAEIREADAAGSGTPDLVAGTLRSVPELTVTNLFCNLNNLLELDLTSDCYAQSYIGAAQTCGRLYSVTGSFSLSFMESCYVLFVDRSAAGSAAYGHLVRLARDGALTLDALSECAAEIASDGNGRSGLALSAPEGADALFWSMGIPLTEAGPDGALTIADTSDRIAQSFRAVYRAFYSTEACELISFGGTREPLDRFANGKTAMTILPLSKIASLPDPGSVSVLPLPKLNDGQRHYGTCSDADYTTFLIPRDCQAPGASATALQALSYRSHAYVLPAYYSELTGGQYGADPDITACFDLATANPRTDAACIYSGILGDTASVLFGRQMAGGSADITSVAAVCVKTLLRNLPELNRTFRQLTY